MGSLRFSTVVGGHVCKGDTRGAAGLKKQASLKFPEKCLSTSKIFLENPDLSILLSSHSVTLKGHFKAFPFAC